jgi:hypothetical protein
MDRFACKRVHDQKAKGNGARDWKLDLYGGISHFDFAQEYCEPLGSDAPPSRLFQRHPM